MAQKSEGSKKKSGSTSQVTEKKASSKPTSKPKAAKEVDSSPAPKKRKAAEDVSPAVTKKTKPDAKLAAEKPQKKGRAAASEDDQLPKATKSRSDKTKAPKKGRKEKTSAATEDETTTKDMVPFAEDDDASADEVDEDIRAMVAELDSENDEPAEEPKSSYKKGQAVGKIPKAKTVKKKGGEPASDGSKVLYIARLPHGFYEHQMREYFSQFGPITRLRLSRNKKTGASKHFAFMEFADAGDAEIVAKTMDNYLLFGRLLKVKVVPDERIHKELWKGANRRFKAIPWQKVEGAKLAEPKEKSAWTKKIGKTRRKQADRAAKLKSIGYDFEYPELEKPVVVAPAEEVEQIEAVA